MTHYTTDELIQLGYTIDNVKIGSTSLTFEDHGCLSLWLNLEGCGFGISFGGIGLGNGYLGAKEFTSYPFTSEVLMHILNTVGVYKWEDLKGKFIRVASNNSGPIKIIGNIIDDKWFDIVSFVEDKEHVMEENCSDS